MKALYDEKTDNAASCMTEILQEDSSQKQALVQLWKRNVYFANGMQSLGSFGGYPSRETSDSTTTRGFSLSGQANAFVTNEIAPIIRTLVSYITRSRPSVEIFSADKTQGSRLSARISQKIMEAKYDLDHEQESSRQFAYWGLVTGSAFRKDYWDQSSGPEIELPVYDELGNEIIDPNTGEPVTELNVTGNNRVSIKSGFSVGLDFTADSFHDMGYIHESYMADVEWVREAFDVEAPGFTGKAKKVVADGVVGLNLQTLEELKTATPGKLGDSSTTKSNREKVCVHEFYVKPTLTWREGRLIIMANNMALYDGPSPYVFKSLETIWHPYTAWFFEPFVGRVYGKSLVEELIAPQRRLNEINKAIIKNANTVAQVDVLVSELAQMTAGVFGGGGSKVYKWSGVGPEPKKWQGESLPAQFFNERAQIIEQMVRIAGTNFVMSGNVPTGVTAAAALELLMNNATSQQSDTLIAWERAHENAYTIKLNLLKKFGEYPNKNVADYLRSISGDALMTEIDAFKGTDIADGVTLKIETGSMIPKLEKFKRESMMQLMKEGALGPVGEDSPRGSLLREKIQREMGIFDLDVDDTQDVKKAKWENDRMLEGQMPDPQPYDNHGIHIYVLTGWMKDPLYIERASPEVKMLAMQHLQWHQEQQATQQQQQMMQAQMAQNPQLAAESLPLPEEQVLEEEALPLQ